MGGVVLQMAIVLLAPVAAAMALRRRWPLSWGLFGAGAAAFIGSQVLHIPFNAWVLDPAIAALPAAQRLILASVLLGLSAGVFEEVARYVVLRWWRSDANNGPDVLMFGVGHGGIESIGVGVLVGLGAFNIAYVERIGVENLGLTPEMQELVRSQLESFHGAPLHLRLLAAAERLFTMLFHVSASLLVALAVVRRQLRWLAAATALHALYDAGVVWIGARYGLVAAEVWVALTAIPSALLVRWSLRALPERPAPQPAKPPKPSGEPLELRGAVKSFGDVHALRGVSFVIPRGQRACLLGPNGAGKTTAIRLATGAFQPTRGWALLFGASLHDEAFLDAKRRTGIVPQQPGMYEEMTVKQYLDLVAQLYQVASYHTVAERLGLDEYMDRRTSKLSGGMQRRLCLAAALMSHPDLLILDEPSAGLDPVAAREMADLLKEVSQGRTTLLCTHDLDEAEELCDSVIILQGGNVLVHESIEALRRRAALVVAVRVAEGPDRLKTALAELGHEGRIAEQEVHVTAPEGEALVSPMLRGLLEQGLQIHECRLIRPTLEDLFLELVQTGEVSP